MDRVKSTWDNFTNIVSNIPRVDGSLEDIVGGLLLAGVTAVIGFFAYNLISG